MSHIVPIIVIVIIVLQVLFFIMNVLRMRDYRKIFEKERTWSIAHNTSTGFVSGILGNGNKVFESIKESINKYLGNNSGSVIDFQLLKDAVDRHCDSVENDINTLTPVPLYCGLAGTMAGVIIGLGSLITEGSINSLLTSGGDYQAAANGVNDLLEGVAWAMLASICGIFLTTLGSLLFKRYKQKGESGKNTFLAWLQAKLLPELPSDTSDALNRLVKNLNSFNNTFASNTQQLRGALQHVNESYRIQAEIIKSVHDMDVEKMATINIRVLRELNECTDKLETFNQYLDDIHGYTDAINEFTTRFQSLGILDEMKLYFQRHKAEIAKSTADSDVALRDAIRRLKESTTSNVLELHKVFTQQAEEFKGIISEERETFIALNRELKAQFSSKLSEIPMLQSQLAQISAIPSLLDKVIQRMEQSNAKLATDVSASLNQVATKITQLGNSMQSRRDPMLHSYQPAVTDKSIPKWMGWTILFTVILIAMASIANTAYNIWRNETAKPQTIVISNDDIQGVVPTNSKPTDNPTDNQVSAPTQESAPTQVSSTQGV